MSHLIFNLVPSELLSVKIEEFQLVQLIKFLMVE